jgi:drug/metabolite transporter (DMT)-like permease
MSNRLQSNLLLLSASMIWGLAFVAQRQGMAHIGPFTFNGLRFLLGAVSLLPLFFLMKPAIKSTRGSTGLLKNAIFAGLILCCAASLQQMGMVHTSAGNAGFITSFYIIFVPLFGEFTVLRSRSSVWVGALIAILGFYLLSVGKGFNVQHGDLLVLCSAVFWALHLRLLSQIAPRYDFRLLAILQYVLVGLVSLAIACFTEHINLAGISKVIWPIIYAGVASVGLGFTLQLIAQRHTRADDAALILSLEAVFAFIGGWIILSETSGIRALAGCALILAGVIYTQLRIGKKALPRKQADKGSF